MAIGFRGADTAVNGINSITPTVNANQVVGDMMILIAGGKGFDLGWSVTTSGWTALGRGQSGTTVAGVDTGSMAMQVWYKEATVDPETNPTVTEGTPTWNVAAAWIIVFSKGAGEVWSTPTVVYGADEVTGTSISATMSANNDVTGGDYVIASLVSNTDVLSPYTTDVTATQTGVTFGTWTARQDNLTTAGGDMSWDNSTAPVTAGPSSAAAVLSATGTASGGADRSELGYIRLRVTTAPAATSLAFPPRQRRMASLIVR
jgi:hypothetical protein